MSGFGAVKRELRESTGTKRIKTMTIHVPSHEDPSAGHVVEHEYDSHKPERFQFAAKENENGNLAAHLSKHLGVKLPGKPAESAESAESKASFE